MSSILENRPVLTAEVEKVAEVAGYLWEKGWAERNGGNITVNVTEYVDDAIRAMPAIAPAAPIGMTLPNLKGCYFFCKGTNKRMRDLARKPMANGSVIRITDDCAHYEIIADEPVKPTSELPSHLAVHNYLIGKGSKYKASLHTHPIELVAMSHCNPGSNILAESTIKELADYDVTLWEKHGVFAVEEDIMMAFDQVDVLNKSAQIYICAKNMGFEPDGMSDEQMKEMTVAFNLPK